MVIFMEFVNTILIKYQKREEAYLAILSLEK
jgi:hypothetical protein